MSFQALSTGRTISGGSTTDIPGLKLGANFSTVIGSVAAPTNQGQYNCIIGTDANRQGGNTTAAVMIGYQAGYSLASAGHVIIGNAAGYTLVDGGCNSVMVGSLVAFGAAVADACVYAGYNCARNLQGRLCVAVGPHNNASVEAVEAVGTTSIGAFTTATGARGLAAGYSNAHAATGGATVGDGCVNTGAGSVVVGSGVVNTGADSLVLMSAGARCAGYSNSAAETLNVQNCLVGSRDAGTGRYETELRGDDVTLVAANGVVRVVGLLDCTGGGSVSNGLRADQMSASAVRIGLDTDPQWTIALSNVRVPAGATSQHGDIVLASQHGTTVVFTDDFVPGLMNFTAQHRCLPAPGAPDMRGWIGHIVVATGRYCGLDDADTVQICEAVPVVALSTSARDPRVFGVVADVEPGAPSSSGGSARGGASRRDFQLGSLRFSVAAGGGAARVMINSLGEGAVWVCDANGPLRNGDLVVTSDHPGLGMRQGDDVVRSCTVAKVTADEDFAGAAPHPVTGLRRAFVGCTYKC
jgi:hypothetical protein